MNKKLLTGIALGAASLMACFSFAACSNGGDDEEQKNDPTPNPPPVVTTPEEQTPVWQEESWEYTDGEGNAATLNYALYFPEAYSDTGAALPLITYVPDASYQRQTITKVESAACPANWITEENMQKYPAVFLVLTLTLNASGNSYTALDDEHSEQYQVNEIIDSVCEDYNIDLDRLYLTGQSMGGILDWGLNTKYPDKFAATVYVGCQPGNNDQKGDDGRYLNDEMYEAIMEEAAFVNQKFIYIASRKDPKAPYGQDDVESILTENGAEFGKLYTLDKDDAAANTSALTELFANGYDKYLLGFPQVGDGSENSEHMGSFPVAYAVNELYVWLLSQKNGYSDGDKVAEADLPTPRETTDINLGETLVSGFKKEAKLVWDLSDAEGGVTQYMLSLSYTAGEDDKDDALCDIVYYVGLTTENGTEWTYCLSSYKKNNGMGGAGTGLNITSDVTSVTVILEKPGNILDRDIYVTLKTNVR